MLICKFLDAPKKEYKVDFSKFGHVVTLTGNVPQDTSGFTLSREGKKDAWDYKAFTTIYRVLEGAVQFSDDGSVYVEPTRDVVVQVSWDDGDDIKGIRPESLLVSINDEMGVTLNADNGWSYTLHNEPMDKTYMITCEAVEDYTAEISGTYITERTDYPVPEELTVDDLAEAVAELADQIVTNATDILETQEAVAELYEMLEG